jgi:thymidylate synthase ThyX
MRTKIIKIKGDWEEVVNDCRSTVGKPPLGKEPSQKFKREILISEHSTIRAIIIKWIWHNIPSWVATHWSRHKWECYIKTQRSDRTGISRDKLPQDAPVNFTGEANTQHLIDSFRKRLCYMASRETRKYAEDFKRELHNPEPEISDVLVPSCVYRAGCPEPNGCRWYETISELYPGLRSTNIQERYDTYNKLFHATGGDSNAEN